MNDAAVAIDYFAKPYTRRREAGAYVAGQWQTQSHADATIQAAVFAVKPNDVLSLPEGERLKISWTIWSRSEIRGPSEEDQTVGDLFLVGTQWHRVKQVQDRLEGGYYKALLERDLERSRSVSSTPSVVGGGDWY